MLIYFVESIPSTLWTEGRVISDEKRWFGSFLFGFGEERKKDEMKSPDLGKQHFIKEEIPWLNL